MFLSLDNNGNMMKNVSLMNLEFPTNIEDTLWDDNEILGTRSFYNFDFKLDIMCRDMGLSLVWKVIVPDNDI